MADYDIGEAFRAIEHELISSMTRNLVNHKIEELVEKQEWAQWQVMQLEALEEYKRRNAAKFPKQFSEINDRIEQEINTSYSAAQTAQEREILKRIHNGTPAPSAPFTGIQGEFFKVNDRKMNALTDAVTNDMQKAEYAVLRMTNDKYRSIIFNAQVYANSGAATYEKAVDMATKDFLSAGINCIQYKDGRRVPIDAYAEMALRTANKRAYLQGEGDMRKKWGIHTVILNKRTNACPKCAPFCGQIIVDDVWSGGTAEEAEKGGYLLMSDCIAHGLYHPNCQDSHTTYFGDFLGDDEEDDQTENELEPLPENEVQANTDSAETLLQQFTPEEREQNIELYNAQQRLNHCQRQVQRFERLEEFSLDEGNKQSYGARLNEWKEKSRETGLELDEMKKLQKREGLHASQLVYSGETVRRVNFSFDSNDEERSENSTGENVANSGESGIIKNEASAIDSMFYADDYEYQTFTKEEIIEHLKTSPVGLDSLQYLEENPQVKVMLSEDREVADRGHHENNLLTIWLNNCPNVRVAAQTVVHEITHHKYNIGGSQLAETICFAFEKMHKEGRDYITREEWNKLADLVKMTYWDYPSEGGVGDIERFKKIIK